MNEINLVGVGPKKYNEKKLRLARITAVFALFLTGLASVGLFFLNTRFSAANVKNQQTQVISQISSYNERIAKISVVNARVLEIRKLREQNVNYTDLIQTILGMLPEEVTITNLEIEEKKTLLTVSSDSLLPISEFVKRLLKFSEDSSKNKQAARKVIIESISAQDKTGNFTMTVRIEMP